MLIYTYSNNAITSGLLLAPESRKPIANGVYLLYSFTHVKAHFDTVLGMVWKGLWQAGHTVIAVSQNFDPHAFIFLWKYRVIKL